MTIPSIPYLYFKNLNMSDVHAFGMKKYIELISSQIIFSDNE